MSGKIVEDSHSGLLYRNSSAPILIPKPNGEDGASESTTPGSEDSVLRNITSLVADLGNVWQEGTGVPTSEEEGIHLVFSMDLPKEKPPFPMDSPKPAPAFPGVDMETVKKVLMVAPGLNPASQDPLKSASTQPIPIPLLGESKEPLSHHEPIPTVQEPCVTVGSVLSNSGSTQISAVGPSESSDLYGGIPGALDFFSSSRTTNSD